MNGYFFCFQLDSLKFSRAALNGPRSGKVSVFDFMKKIEEKLAGFVTTESSKQSTKKLLAHAHCFLVPT